MPQVTLTENAAISLIHKAMGEIEAYDGTGLHPLRKVARTLLTSIPGTGDTIPPAPLGFEDTDIIMGGFRRSIKNLSPDEIRNLIHWLAPLAIKE